jgi:hypothetical protein
MAYAPTGTKDDDDDVDDDDYDDDNYDDVLNICEKVFIAKKSNSRFLRELWVFSPLNAKKCVWNAICLSLCTRLNGWKDFIHFKRSGIHQS